MANLPISISINWKPFVFGFLVVFGLLYYFSGHITKIFRPVTKAHPLKMLRSDFVKFGDVEEAIFYQTISPEKPLLKVLFLHGQRFSSEDWKKKNTLEFLAKKGYEVMAIDLPGFGKSKFKTPSTPADKGKFLSDFISRMGYKNAVLVVPSMSGSFAFPFIFTGGNVRLLKGFVPIAPVGTEGFKEEQFKALSLPTMAVFGQDDKMSFVAGAKEKLKLIPGVEVKTIDHAGHACYLDQPAEFHSLMESFLEKLQKS